jgi:L-threonylcarbamoyladenylate synthase
MEIIKIKDQQKISKAVVKKISVPLLEEKTLILPAATIYGLSCKFDSRAAIENIYRIKRRKKELPFIVLISNMSSLKDMVDSISPAADKLIEKYWNIEGPLPLTMIFKKNKGLEGFITGGSPNIAIRIAGLEFVRQLIDICGPIVSTSATISGIKDPPLEIKDIPRSIKEEADLIVDWGRPLPGIQSTIIDASRHSPELVREGAVKLENSL